MNHLSLFSGIGGFDLGFRNTGGYETVAFCEADPFCQKILAKHWPSMPCYDDVRTLNYDRLQTDGIADIDIITGGFPCQAVSLAGQGKGDQDERWLWPEYHRLIREIRPRWVVAENVPGLVSNDTGRLFRGILRDLAELGYDALWRIISAADVGAPHLRKRVWIIAHASSTRSHGSWAIGGEPQKSGVVSGMQDAATHSESQERTSADSCIEHWAGGNTRARRRELCAESVSRNDGLGNSQADGREIESVLCRVDDGLSRGLDELGRWPKLTVSPLCEGVPGRPARLKALGNAIVPQIAQIIGTAIIQTEEI